jgi:hypothetical protein
MSLMQSVPGMLPDRVEEGSNVVVLRVTGPRVFSVDCLLVEGEADDEPGVEDVVEVSGLWPSDGK